MPANDDSIPMVSALVDYLEQHDPARIAGLRERFPGERELLAPGRKLGNVVRSEDPHQEAPRQRLRELFHFDSTTDIEKDHSALLITLAHEALEAAKARLGDNSETLKRRMRRAANVRLGGNLVAALSGVGLIGALVAEAQLAAIATATVSLTSTTVSLVSQHLDAPVYGKGSGTRELFGQLVIMTRNIVELEQMLAIRDRTGYSPLVPEELARRANALVAELRSLEVMIKGP